MNIKEIDKIKEAYHYQINKIDYFENEFWTSKQRQGNALHEISYRACFKSELPKFFISHFSKEKDIIYDPFSGRGTTIIEALLNNRYGISNDVNLLNKIYTEGRLYLPTLSKIEERLNDFVYENLKCDIDLSMFYHHKTLNEILNFKKYFINNKLDYIDKWIRMVITSYLHGHSNGHLSVRTLPPNLSITQKGQQKLNIKNKTEFIYKEIKYRILKKSKSLLKHITDDIRKNTQNNLKHFQFYNKDARQTKEIPNNYIQLTITSPPFLNIVDYKHENWIKMWFNDIKLNDEITMSKTVLEWSIVMQQVFDELYRITKNNGFVMFEVGELKNIKLDEIVVPLGINSGFKCLGVLINQQSFTKTSNIFGVSNNTKGTNTNRIVMFQKCSIK